MARKKIKRRRRQGDAPTRRKKPGMLIGMRRGFKNLARSVGVDEKDAQRQKRSWASTAFNVAIVIAVAAILYYRFGR